MTLFLGEVPDAQVLLRFVGQDVGRDVSSGTPGLNCHPANRSFRLEIPLMPRRFRTGLIALAALLTFGAGAAVADDIAELPLGDPSRAYLMGSGESGQIISCMAAAAGSAVSLEALAADLASVDVVIIGEDHVNIDGHRTQWNILEALAKTGRPFALGMEFFEIEDDEALARYTRGEIDLARMLEETGWYTGGGYNFEYYRPLVETCREHRAPIYGLNVPRMWIRTISREGVDALSEQQRAAVGELGPVDTRHKYLINQMMGGIGVAMPQMFEGMYRGQTAWDAAMARSIVRAHENHMKEGTRRTIVVIVGAGHMAHGLAIPARLRSLDPTLTIRTIGPVRGSAPAEDAQLHPGFERKETAVFSLGYADYAYVIPDSGNIEAYPQIGVRLDRPKDAPEGTPLRVTSITPGGVADRAGLRKDDVVLGIDGDTPRTAEQAGAMLGMMRWNQRISWKITRLGVEGEMSIAMLVVPPTDADSHWLKSRPASGLMDTFDPASSRSYLEPSGFKPGAAHARLATYRGKPVRIDVLREGVLLEAWNLDEEGRPVLGLLSSPARDGAVRIEIARDAQGAATSVRRFNGAGAEITPPAAASPTAPVGK